jgi:hypothetical protein
MTDKPKSNRKSKEGKPSVYATHIAKLLSGDSECEYAVWFKSHYWYSRIEDKTFDSASWTADHTAMVKKRAEQLETAGWTVTTEKANKFELVGRVGSIVGTPDIVARKYAQRAMNIFDAEPGTETPPAVRAIRIVDCKTGKQKASDYMQVLLYLYAEIVKHPEVRPFISGEVQYKGQELAVPSADITPERIAHISNIMRTVCGDETPKASPSNNECKFCDIGPADCQWRITPEKLAEQAVSTEDF